MRGHRAMNVLGACRVPADPGMRQRLFARVTLVRIAAHQMRDEILGRIADLVPIRRIELVFAFDDLREQICIVLIIERRIAAQEDIGNYA